MSSTRSSNIFAMLVQTSLIVKCKKCNKTIMWNETLECYNCRDINRNECWSEEVNNRNTDNNSEYRRRTE